MFFLSLFNNELAQAVEFILVVDKDSCIFLIQSHGYWWRQFNTVEPV